MTKADFIAGLAEKTSLTKTEVTSVVDSIVETVENEVYINGGTLNFGLGTFKQKKTADKVGRNPRTGQAVDIPAKTKLAFSPAVKFKG